MPRGRDIVHERVENAVKFSMGETVEVTVCSEDEELVALVRGLAWPGAQPSNRVMATASMPGSPASASSVGRHPRMPGKK